ncbi:MAG TPA: serine protease [Patescibacteria group bacterium]|nr:serine protease [Patescibacteria group bacterium]
MKNKYLVYCGIFFLALLLLTGGAFFYVQKLKKQPSSEKNVKEATLSQEDIINLTKPSVVRLIQHIKGKAEIPDVKIDFNKMDIIPNPSAPLNSVEIDEYITGSGFIVNSNGYIVTNSHVVSYQTIKNALAGLKVIAVLDRDLKNADLSKKSELNGLQAEDAGRKLAIKMINYIAEKGKFSLEKKVVVLDPSSTTDDKNKMFEEGFPAGMISVNDNYYNDDKDIALIKIDQTNLPSLEFGDSTAVNSGNKISVFGFPSTAEVNGKNYLESTFTDGTISALKDSEKSVFKFLQSDAKVSQGSSGGPMIDEQGRVIGLLTLGSNMNKETGDSFGFAIPISEASLWIDDFNVNQQLKPAELNEKTYADHFKKGLGYLDASHCQQAIAEFNKAKVSNLKFSNEKYIQGYIDKCNSKIQSGQSIDTGWDEKKQNLSKINKTTWYIIGGGFALLIVAVFLILLLTRRLKKEEQEMSILENKLNERPNQQMPDKKVITPMEKDSQVSNSTVVQKKEIIPEKIEITEKKEIALPKKPELISEKNTVLISSPSLVDKPTPPTNLPVENSEGLGKQKESVKSKPE